MIRTCVNLVGSWISSVVVSAEVDYAIHLLVIIDCYARLSYSKFKYRGVKDNFCRCYLVDIQKGYFLIILRTVFC